MGDLNDSGTTDRFVETRDGMSSQVDQTSGYESHRFEKRYLLQSNLQMRNLRTVSVKDPIDITAAD